MEPTSGPSRSTFAARCANHPECEALAICTRCGAFACAACHQVATDGRPYCNRCLAMWSQPPLADRGTRFVANLIDRMAIVILIVAATIVGLIADAAKTGGQMSEDPPAWFIAVILLGTLGMLGFLIVQLLMQVTYGQSIGKRLLGIRVVRMDGGPVSLARIVFVRNLVPELIGAGCNIFGLVDALFIFADNQRCLHDLLSDTKVIRVR